MDCQALKIKLQEYSQILMLKRINSESPIILSQSILPASILKIRAELKAFHVLDCQISKSYSKILVHLRTDLFFFFRKSGTSVKTMQRQGYLNSRQFKHYSLRSKIPTKPGTLQDILIMIFSNAVTGLKVFGHNKTLYTTHKTYQESPRVILLQCPMANQIWTL